MSESPQSESVNSAPETPSTGSRFQWLGWSTFFLAAVQSVCTLFVAVSGLRLLLSAATFGAALGVMKFFDTNFHIDAIRIPMIIFALVGALFNLVALWQVKRLRNRSASAWRQKQISKSKLTSEGFQLALSITTLLLLAAESYYHYQMNHHL